MSENVNENALRSRCVFYIHFLLHDVEQQMSRKPFSIRFLHVAIVEIFCNSFYVNLGYLRI